MTKNITAVPFNFESPGKSLYFSQILDIQSKLLYNEFNERTIGPENAHLKPDLGVLGHHEMTLTLNTHTPLLTS